MNYQKMMSKRAYNFGAGPATLPESILLSAQAELLDWQGLGLSVMEIGHRTPEFLALMEQLECLLRQLLSIPKQYHVLFLGLPARTQFAMVPLNLLTQPEQGAYLVSGVWSEMAYQEAAKLTRAYCVASSEPQAFYTFPPKDAWQLKAETGYLYYTPNETIHGVRFPEVPKFEHVPLIADMTSCLLTEPIDVCDYDLIFAGAQKNIAPPGLTLVIIKDELLNKRITSPIPSMLDYRVHVNAHSMYATPPVFNCYLALKMLQWIHEQGGVLALHQANCEKAALLYGYLDQSSFYQTAVEKQSRSLVNVCFSLTKTQLEEEFIKRANHRGLLALKGHSLVGGMRVSLYNSMPLAGVEALVAFMDEFSEEYA